MSQEHIDNLNKDVQEIKSFLAASTRQRVKDLLSMELRRLETLLIEQMQKSPKTEAPKPIASSVPATQRRYHVELKEYAWDQSDKFVKIFISIDGVQKIPEDSVIVEFTDKTINVMITDLNSRDYTFVVNNLLEPIDAEKSYRRVKTDMIAIYMKKVKEGSKWSYMTATEKRLKDIKDPKLEEELGEAKDPGASLMHMMKKLYDTGDSDMKRMINKAWAEGQEKRSTEPPLDM